MSELRLPSATERRRVMSKVLLINDCRFESMVMKDMLDGMGYDVDITNEYEALNKVKYSYPDIVIANLIMKSIQGDELIEKIKRSREDIKCILSSSNSIALDTYKNKRVDAVIHTPIKKEELIEALQCNKSPSGKTGSEYNFCPYCGQKLNGEFAFCSYCGHKIK